MAFDGATPFYVLSDSATGTPAQEWYRNFDLAAERARGLPDRTDHFFAGELRATIAPGSRSRSSRARRRRPLSMARPRSRSARAKRARFSTGSSRRISGHLQAPSAGSPATCSRGGPVHCRAPARRRSRREDDPGRISLVQRLGPRHDDCAAGIVPRDGAAVARAQHPANVLPLRERRHAAQSISARG